MLVWINFFGIIYDTEKQGENTVYTKCTQTNIIPFICEYILVNFYFTFSIYDCGGLCYDQCNVTGTGTVNGTAPIRVSYKEGYYHTCILQLGIMADSQHHLYM
jgi:hypothetical protein